MSDAPRPVRLRLSRRAGFSFQAASRAVNGLPAVRVSRPGRWGNSYRIGLECNTAEESVAKHREGMAERLAGPTGAHLRAEMDTGLRGHNLACWCRLDAPCHADTLLELANP